MKTNGSSEQILKSTGGCEPATRIDASGAESTDLPTLWGLNSFELHEHFWGSRNTQLLRVGQGVDVQSQAGQYLLLDAEHLIIFGIRRLHRSGWLMRPRLTEVEIRNQRKIGQRELTVTGRGLQLDRFQRIYPRPDHDSLTVYVTEDENLARAWANAEDLAQGVRVLETEISRGEKTKIVTPGMFYGMDKQRELMEFTRDLVSSWRRPGIAIQRASHVDGDVWIDKSAVVSREAKLVGSVWIGAARQIDETKAIVGPTILWDEPEARPEKSVLIWSDSNTFDSDQDPDDTSWESRPKGPFGKRLFDLLFSSFMLLMTLPLYPFIMLLIYLDDGRPFFFAHRRQSFGGREFPCLKFRTMRKDAEKIKEELARKNMADGPQFFMEKDPRLLRIGDFLRKTKLDELPQFLNVILGHMSVIGPRPSPHNENQYCPAWREARLSTRPGITGLWQVKRTRRAGLDFQEWIQFDIEYVETVTWRLEFWILWETVKISLHDIWRLFRKK